MIDLTSKVAIVTGAGRGIGSAIALKLAGHGATVAVLDRNADRANDTAQEMAKLGFSAIAFKVDVTKKAEVDALARQVLARFGSIDILVNNVGWLKWERFQDNDPELWDNLVNANLKGTIYCSRAALDHMVEKKKGKIVNIASDAGRTGFTGQAVYAAAKAGVIAFTKSLALEVARYNININCVSPGITQTPLLMEGINRSPDVAAELDKVARAIPLGKIARPEDIAEAVYFFASAASDHITGQILSVNGGSIMPG